MTLTTLTSSLCLLSLCLPLRPLWAQGVEPYPHAITNRLFYPKTQIAPPVVNSPFPDPDLGAMIVRVTDGNTNPQIPKSFFRNPSEDSNEWSLDNTKFYVMGAESKVLAFAFDPETMITSALPGAGRGGALMVPLNAGPTFSFLDPDLMYGTLQRAPLTIGTYRFSTGAVQPIFDTTNCHTQPPLVARKGVSSNDNTLSSDDNRVVISAGGNAFGVQPFVIVYDQKLGCRWYNTQTGQIGGQWGAKGQVNLPERFLVNHSAISGNGRYVRIGSVTPGFAGFYIWDVSSLNIQTCRLHTDLALHCSGYFAIGYDAYINAAGSIDELNTLRRPLGDIDAFTPLINPLPLPHYFGMTKHFAWNNGRVNSSVPVCGTTYSEAGDTQVKQPYDGEVFCMQTDGVASTVWRFAHNRAKWNGEYYWTEPFGNLSLDGRFFAFTSGWDSQVGTDQDGDPRTDVWIVKLK